MSEFKQLSNWIKFTLCCAYEKRSKFLLKKITYCIKVHYKQLSVYICIALENMNLYSNL